MASLSANFDKGDYCISPISTEPPRDKPTKWHVRPTKTQISLGIRQIWSVSFLSTWRERGSLATHWAQANAPIRLGGCPGSDWVDAQTDLSLRWAHSHFVGFVMSRLKCWSKPPHGRLHVLPIYIILVCMLTWAIFLPALLARSRSNVPRDHTSFCCLWTRILHTLAFVLYSIGEYRVYSK